jgi:NADH-quinone oxidoreductase subunit J
MEFLTAHGGALLWWAFAVLTVIGALGVIGLRNPLYSAVSLLVTFLSVAALFLLRHAEFISIVQFFVYGGGIMVLFLFVIMLINLHRLQEVRTFVAQLPIAGVLALLFAALLGWLCSRVDFADIDTASGALRQVEGELLGNSEAVAWLLYRDYLLPFEVASLFLLVAMIGAVVLGRRH